MTGALLTGPVFCAERGKEKPPAASASTSLKGAVLTVILDLFWFFAHHPERAVCGVAVLLLGWKLKKSLVTH